MEKLSILPSAKHFDRAACLSDAAFRLWIAIYYVAQKNPDGFDVNYSHFAKLLHRSSLEINASVAELQSKGFLVRGDSDLWRLAA